MSVQSPYLRGVLLAVTGMVLISPDGLLLNLIRHTDPWTVVFWRSLFSGLVIGLFVTLRYRRRAVSRITALGVPGLVAGVLIAVSNTGFVGAMLNTSVANVLVILATMPLFSALFGVVWLREPVRGRTWATIAVAFSGIVILFWGSLGGGHVLGDLIAVGIAVTYGVALVVLRGIGNHDNMPVIALAGLLAAAATVGIADPLATDWYDIGIIALDGLVVVPFALALFLSGTRTVPAAEIAVLTLVETVLGPLWAWIGLGQEPAATSFFGGALVLIALAGNAAAAILGRRTAAAG